MIAVTGAAAAIAVAVAGCQGDANTPAEGRQPTVGTGQHDVRPDYDGIAPHQRGGDPGLAATRTTDEPSRHHIGGARAVAPIRRRGHALGFRPVDLPAAATSGVADPESERAWASTFLAAEHRFAATAAAPGWPAAAHPAITALLRASTAQQGHLVAMSRAASALDFTADLGAYSVDTAGENTAVAAVRRSLGG